MLSVIEFSHRLLQEHVTKEDVALDLTVGNGHDILFLTQVARFVYGFDIQAEALERAATRLAGRENYLLIKDSHENFPDYVKEGFKAAVFNLGYLPGGDKTITTKAEATLKTVRAVLENILPGGICVIVVYPGHPEGKRESNLLLEYLSGLEQTRYQALKYEFINQINDPPYLLAVRRMK
jgi:hypothetical protein